MTERIDAPKRILETVLATERQIERLKGELNGIIFGAQAALDVPEGWLWNGTGWTAPAKEAPVQPE